MATFFNQATLSYSGGTVNSNIATGEIVEVLSATKTATTDSYTLGSDITYAINIVNTGAGAFNGLTVTDNLGEYTFGTGNVQPLEYVDNSVRFFVNGVLQATPVVTATNPLTITNINIPENGVATLLYTARVNSFANPETAGTIVNTATINGGGITEITVDETVTAESEPNLTINKAVSPTTVTENGQITYTFTIQNIGNAAADATDNVVITDTFNPILSNVTVTYNGTIWTEGVNYTYNQATGLFATNIGQITVPAATYTQNATTGIWTVDPGTATITVTGTV